MKKFKSLLILIKATEAKKILDASPFYQHEKNRNEITCEIFNAIICQSEIKSKAANQIAKYYIKSFPFFESFYSYNRLDLALALNNHYQEILPEPINELSDLSLTVQQTKAIVKRLFEDYDHKAIPQDLESKSKGLIGEFVRYRGKSATFLSYIEGKRSAQYHALGFDSYYESERFYLLQQLASDEKAAQKAARAATERDPDGSPTLSTGVDIEPENNPVEAENTAETESVQTPQEDIHYQVVEVYEDEYENQEDDYGFESDGGVDLESQSDDNGFVDDEGVEVMDSDDEDWLNQVD